VRFDRYNFFRVLEEAELNIGSDAHRRYGEQMASYRQSKNLKHMELLGEMTDVLLDVIREHSSMPKHQVVCVVRDVVPFTIGSIMWAETGFPSIALTHDFQRSIAVTDFGDARDEPLHMPFPAFVLRLPETLRGEDKATQLFVFPAPLTTTEGVGFFSERMIVSVSPENALKQTYTQWTRGIPYDAFLNGQATEMTDVSEAERRTSEELGYAPDPDIPRRARRVLGNTLLYINASGGLPTEKRIGNDFPVEREHSVAHRYRVGRPIKLGPQLKEAIRIGLSGGQTWKLVSRFMVRGHWRNQAHGPSMSLRTRKWISPFWKGPETITEALERAYEVT
jgi:hypothetical protein